MKKLLILLLFSPFFGASQQIIINSDTLTAWDLDFNALFPDTKLKANVGYYNLLWKIENNNLYLIDIDNLSVMTNSDGTLDIHDVNFQYEFKDKIINGKVFANWITDTLLIEYGESVSFPRMYLLGNSHIYFENEIQIVVNEGKVLQICKYYNVERDSLSISIFDFNAMDTIIKTLNKNVIWKKLPFDFSVDERDWTQDIFVLYLFADGKTEIKVFDEKGVMSGDYSCGNCKNDLKRAKEINRALSPLKFSRLSRFGDLIDTKIVLDIEYDIREMKIVNPYLEK